MTFLITRLGLRAAAIFIVIIMWLKKRKVWRKRVFVITFLIMLIIIEISGIAPIENTFISFETPEAALNYYTVHGEVLDIVYGKDSCMVIYVNTRDDYEIQYFPRDDGGYKLPSVWTVRRVSDYMSPEGTFQINHIQGTGDYYLSGIYTFSQHLPVLSDNVGTTFKWIKLESVDTYYNYAYLNLLPDDYYLVIDEVKIFLK